MSCVREGGKGPDGQGRGISQALFLHVKVSEDEVWVRCCCCHCVIVIICEGGRERSGSLGELEQGRLREGEGGRWQGCIVVIVLSMSHHQAHCYVIITRWERTRERGRERGREVGACHWDKEEGEGTSSIVVVVVVVTL